MAGFVEFASGDAGVGVGVVVVVVAAAADAAGRRVRALDLGHLRGLHLSRLRCAAVALVGVQSQWGSGSAQRGSRMGPAGS